MTDIKNSHPKRTVYYISFVCVFLIIMMIIYSTYIKPKTKIINLSDIPQNGLLDNNFYTPYTIISSEWKDGIDTKFGSIRPDSKFLSILIVIKNIDDKPIKIPKFSLLDKNDNIYTNCNTKFFMTLNIEIFDNINELNPGVCRTGYFIFDVPENNKYYLVPTDDKYCSIISRNYHTLVKTD